jgi:hypothetical protein
MQKLIPRKQIAIIANRNGIMCKKYRTQSFGQVPRLQIFRMQTLNKNSSLRTAL